MHKHPNAEPAGAGTPDSKENAPAIDRGAQHKNSDSAFDGSLNQGADIATATRKRVAGNQARAARLGLELLWIDEGDGAPEDERPFYLIGPGVLRAGPKPPQPHSLLAAEAIISALELARRPASQLMQELVGPCGVLSAASKSQCGGRDA